jgi:hypothetical protein
MRVVVWDDTGLVKVLATAASSAAAPVAVLRQQDRSSVVARATLYDSEVGPQERTREREREKRGHEMG